MKRFTTLLLLTAICLMAAAQAKLTPQAQLKVLKQQKKFVKAKAKGTLATTELRTIRLVVKMQPTDKKQTLAEIRQRDAKVEGLLGDQLIISLPIDSVESLSRIAGIVRIDAGRKGRLKTDVSREQLGVNLLNGPAATREVPLTGAGVSVCIIDVGIDFQHPAFKNADGSSRIKAVYCMVKEDGKKLSYTVHDDEMGDVDITLPGSVYDTPELIATLTTDTSGEEHGTHTTSTVAGTLSPQGFGGMAPDADIVLVPLGTFGGEEEVALEDDEYLHDAEDIIAALNFAALYAQQTEQPMVLSASLGTHKGPHDGTSSVCEAISDISEYLIPVFAAGNEGNEKNYLGYDFTDDETSMNTFLSGVEENGFEADALNLTAELSGYIYNVADGREVTLRLSLVDIDDPDTPIWQSPVLTLDSDEGAEPLIISSEDDEEFNEVFDGDIKMSIGVYSEKCIEFNLEACGMIRDEYYPVLTVTAPAGAHLDMWDENNGFEGGDIFVDGAKGCSASDWSSTENVISVGAYCANTLCRELSGDDYDINEDLEEDEEPMPAGSIAIFSSYGKMPNGVVQPTVCAPGVNVVAAVNHYYRIFTNVYVESMMWQGFPYNQESGTSMACPTVAGIIALWLEACPTLTLSDVKDVLAHSSDNDDFTAIDPLRWGYGKINAKKGLDYIQENYVSVIREVGHSQSATGYYFDLQGRRVTNPARGIYIVDGHKVIVK